MNRPPVALPRVKTVLRLRPETLKTLERERKRRGLGLGQLIDDLAKWLLEPLTRDQTPR